MYGRQSRIERTENDDHPCTGSRPDRASDCADSRVEPHHQRGNPPSPIRRRVEYRARHSRRRPSGTTTAWSGRRRNGTVGRLSCIGEAVHLAYTHPALTRKAQEMNRPNPTTSPPAAPSSSAQTRLSPDAARAALRAARYAVAAHPGPIGELISRELHSYVDTGEQVHAPALAARLILALQRGEAQNPLRPIQSDWRHLPAQYIPGSPMHWRYRTIADDAEGIWNRYAAPNGVAQRAEPRIRGK